MKKRTGENRIVTMPNILSLVRILMIPFIIISFNYGEYFMTGVFVVLSGLTDFLDGYIARKYREITKIGKILDPIADKLTQLALLYLLVLIYPMLYITLIIFILKELTMGLFNLYFMMKGHEYEGAIIYGKVSTMVFYISIILIFLIKNISTRISAFFLILTTIFLLISWFGHMVEYAKQYNGYKEKGQL